MILPRPQHPDQRQHPGQRQHLHQSTPRLNNLRLNKLPSKPRLLPPKCLLTSMPQKKTKIKSALAVRDLTVSYGSNRVVDDVSFRVPQGTVMGLIGPNGAGKSTIIKSVIDLISLERGDIRFFGEPLSRSRHRVAYMPQAADVDWDYPITVEQVVAMGLYPKLGWFRRMSAEEKRLVAANLEYVGISDLAKRQISELSGGQRRRVFMARILTQQPDLYLLDEPFAGVDAASEQVIRDVLVELRDQGATILIVHHNLSTVASLCQHVTIVNKRLVASGPIDKAFTKEKVNEAFGLGLV